MSVIDGDDLVRDRRARLDALNAKLLGKPLKPEQEAQIIADIRELTNKLREPGAVSGALCLFDLEPRADGTGTHVTATATYDAPRGQWLLGC